MKKPTTIREEVAQMYGETPHHNTCTHRKDFECDTCGQSCSLTGGFVVHKVKKPSERIREMASQRAGYTVFPSWMEEAIIAYLDEQFENK